MRFAWKVTLATLCIIVLSFGMGSYLLVSLSFRTVLEREVDVAQEELQMLRITYVAVCEGKGITLESMAAGGRGLTATLRENPYFSNHRFQISAMDGQKVYSVYSTLDAESDQELLASIGQNTVGYSIREDEKTGTVMIHCAGMVYLPDGTVYMETVRDISSIFVDRETHYKVYRYLLLLIVAVSGGALYLLSTWLTRPIRNLGEVTAQLAQGDYTPRAEVVGSDEISELSENFNRMADAIEKNVQDLEDAARRQEDFTASFVHELKTPLTSIIGYADMLRSRNLEEEKRFKAASYIFSEGKRLENLSLSLMSLMVVGHSAAEIRPVQMRSLCEDVERIAGPSMTAKGLTLAVQADSGVLQGDSALLRTLLLNLLDNARKASAPGGTVTLSGENMPGGYRLRVADQGRGIPRAELSKITEAFYMVDKSRSRAEGGAGLGLALCKEIARFHHGELRFESEEGRGTVVEAVLGGASYE